jgi:hypothetical protein
LRIQPENFADLTDGHPESWWPHWALASRYKIVGGWIYPEGGRKANSTYAPLEEQDLFLSFARLGARGEPSENSMLQWVSKRGLLTRHNKEGRAGRALVDRRTNLVNQAPISMENFRAEVLCAHQLLTLYTAIKTEDSATIRAICDEGKRHRASRWTNTPPTTLEEFLAPHRESSTTEYQLLDHHNVWIALIALGGIVKKRVANVRLDIGDTHDDPNLPWPLTGTHRLTRRYRCEDLLSTMYLQFYLFITGDKPMRHCENPACGMPLLVTRKDKRFCNDTCRSNARNYR